MLMSTLRHPSYGEVPLFLYGDSKVPNLYSLTVACSPSHEGVKTQKRIIRGQKIQSTDFCKTRKCIAGGFNTRPYHGISKKLF